MSTLASRLHTVPPPPRVATALGGSLGPGGRGRLPGDDELMTANDFGHMLKVSRATLYRLLSAGRLPSGEKLNRCRRWSRRNIEAWIAAGCPPRDQWEGS